jgi:ABC-type amino acid transport substrate-binding protein
MGKWDRAIFFLKKIGLLFYFGTVSLFAEDQKTAESSGGFKGITITENQIALLRGIADFFFPYGKEVKNSGETEDPKLVKGEEVCEKVIRGTVLPKLQKTLKIGVLGDNLPLVGMRDGKPIGFEIDLLNLLLEGKAVSPIFEAVDAVDIEKAMGGSVDIVLGGLIKNTPDNAAWDCSESYLNADVVAIFLKKPKKDSQKFSFLKKSIGVIRGSFFEDYIRVANVLDAKIITFAAHGDMFTSLVKEDKNSDHYIDVLLTNSHIARDRIAKYPELESLPLGAQREIVFRVRKGSPWLKVLNRGIKNLQGSHKFSELMHHWVIEKI